MYVNFALFQLTTIEALLGKELSLSQKSLSKY